jgi:hypothetical protein
VHALFGRVTFPHIGDHESDHALRLLGCVIGTRGANLLPDRIGCIDETVDGGLGARGKRERGSEGDLVTRLATEVECGKGQRVIEVMSLGKGAAVHHILRKVRGLSVSGSEGSGGPISGTIRGHRLHQLCSIALQR